MASIWSFQTRSVAGGEPSNTHIQIVDAGSAGWEVQITFKDDGMAPRVHSTIYPTYREAKLSAQFAAQSLSH